MKYKAVENKVVSSCYKMAVPQKRILLIFSFIIPTFGCGSTWCQSELHSSQPKGMQRNWWETSTI